MQHFIHCCIHQLAKRWAPLSASFILILTLTNTPTHAQSMRIGYIDAASILQDMPERARAEQELQRYAQQLDQQIQQMLMEYQKKLEEYQKNFETWPESVREIKQKELADLESNIQEFRLRAQQELQQKQQELLQPLIDKIKQAAQQVARERGYDYVFDASAGVFLVLPPAHDLTPYVRQKLGL